MEEPSEVPLEVASTAAEVAAASAVDVVADASVAEAAAASVVVAAAVAVFAALAAALEDAFAALDAAFAAFAAAFAAAFELFVEVVVAAAAEESVVEAAAEESVAESVAEAAAASVEAASSAEDDAEALASAEPATPCESWPAAALSSLMLLVSFVCSSASLDSRSEVSSPDAFACAICVQTPCQLYPPLPFDYSRQHDKTHLDVDRLDLPSELEDLVLDLAVLQRGRSGAGGSVDRGVEERRLGVLSRLAHRLHGVERGLVDGGEVDAVEGVDEDGVGLRLGVASGAVGDLEVCITGKGQRRVSLAALGPRRTWERGRGGYVLLERECAPGEAEGRSGDEAGEGDDEELGGQDDHLSYVNRERGKGVFGTRLID